MPRIIPDYTFEIEAQARGYLRVVGVDEVGRGPLAGPVTACAVRLDPARIPPGLGDSKTLSAVQREALFTEIVAVAEVSIGHATVEEIDTLNILRASHLAMERAVAGLEAHHALIDGNMIPRGLACSATAIIGGDALCLSIAAASIVAKVTRDRLMKRLGAEHPGYGFERHMGYSVPEHFAALSRLGPTIHHRRSFAPVTALIDVSLPVTIVAAEADLPLSLPTT
jgi:ribonuclease HII